MFITFNFGNFRSFRDMQQFSLEASPLRTNDNGLDENNVFVASGIRLLKTKAIFGANASGKSNLAKAIAAFQFMVSRSVVQESIPTQIWNDRFQLITDWDEQPVFFQYIFLLEGTIYRYGFQILNGFITYEWLYSGIKGNESEYFMRTPEGLVIDKKTFTNPFNLDDGEDSELFRPDSLYLTAAALNGNKAFGKIRQEIRNIMTVDGVYDDSAATYAMSNFISGPEQKRKALINLMKAADTGIEDLNVEEVPEHLIDNRIKSEMSDKGENKIMGLFASHPVYDWEGFRVSKKNVPFGEWESEGTSKWFAIGALILDALAAGRTLVIDEFDARFHPNLTLKIVQLFNQEKTNSRNAQLIFITHDTGLLRRAELRRDQIYIINKDQYGISTASTLIQFKGVRKDASYDKEYLNGAYTGIPYLDQIDQVISNTTNYHGLQQAE